MLRRLKRIHLNTKTAQLLAAASLFSCFLVFSSPVHAQINAGVTEFGTQTALGAGGQGGLIGIISNIVNIGLGFLGILTVLYLLYGGFQWMTSGGDMKKVDSARKTIVRAIIGLIIMLSSWAITIFVLGAIGRATGVEVEGIPGGGGGGGGDGFDSALGSGSLTSHYPGRNAVGVPRNAPIILTFKDPMKVDTIMTATGDLIVNGIKIKPRDGAQLGATEVVVSKTADDKSFTIRPKSPMGNATDVTTYNVDLTGAISKADGTAAFGLNGYTWSFDVSTVLDLTPPTVQSIFPAKNATQVPRNAIVTVTFNEPIDPTSGTVNGAFTVLDISSGTGVAVGGVAKYSNGYRTVEFVPSLACGTSSCGTTVFCLPSGSGTTSNVEVMVKPGTIDTNLGAPAAALPFDGIADTVGNSFDGDADGVAEGPSTDLYSYRFATSDQVRTSPPIIIGITPSSGTQSVAFDVPITVTFMPYMQYSTLGSNNITLRTSASSIPPYWTESTNVPPAAGATEGTTVVTVKHGLFAENASYQPEVGSAVRDAYQNCFSPVEGPSCTTTADNRYCCPNASGAVVAQPTPCAAP